MESQHRWLATLTLGCCASRQFHEEDEDKDEAGLGRDVSGSLMEKMEKRQQTSPVITQQPRCASVPRIEAEPSRPMSRQSISSDFSQWAMTSKDYVQRASSRASTLPKTWTAPTRRPSIGGPTDFRRIEQPPVQIRRDSFRPLELSIYASSNRLCPLPDFTASDWSQKPAELEYPAQAVLQSRRLSAASGLTIQRKPLLSRSITASSIQSSARLSLITPGEHISTPNALPSLPQIASSSHTESMPPVSHRRTSTHISLPSNPSQPRLTSRSPSRGRSNTEPAPPSLRKRPSFMSTKHEIDAAIHELNTIIEERRADAYRTSTNSFSSMLPPPSPSQHVPAIAPTLRMRVRSETLSDIGSAFSAPLVSKPLPLTPREQKTTSRSPLSSPLAVEKEPQLRDARVKRPSTGANMFALKPRLSLWLRRQTRSRSSLSKDALDNRTPFYQCAVPSATQHTPQTSYSSISTLSSTVPSLSERTSTSASIQSPTGPATPRERSLSLSMQSGRGLGKWKGGELLFMGGSSETWGDVKTNPLRLNPKSPIGVGVAY